MRKTGKKITAFSVSFLLMLNMTATVIPVSAEGEFKVYTHDGYTVEYTVKNEWTGNQNIEVTITNTSDDVLSGWAMGYNAFGEIGGLWNAKIYGHQGTEYILSSAGYNDELAPGQSTNFGYTLTGDSFKIPQDIVNCAKRVDIAEGYNVYYNITADFVDTYQAEMIIENTSDTDITAWQLSFDGNASIDNLWNGKLLENNNGSFKVKNSENNSVIAAGSSVSFNFGGTKNTETEPDPGYSEPAETTPPVTVVTDEFSETEAAAESTETDAANSEADPTETGTPTESDVVPVSAVVFSNYKLTGVVIPMEFDFEIDPEVDSDNDGLPDHIEKEIGSDRYNPDTDGDGLPDGYEYLTLATDPTKIDTDDNGICDADEDFDEDGLTNLEEYNLGTDPFSKDTDGDRLSDYDELNIYNTDPLKYDTDGDIVSDGDEIELGLDPNNPATNGYPDNEYTTVQTVDEDNSALDYINTIEDNPYTVSIEITAAGVAENNLSAGESGYSYSILQNDAVLGVVPELSYSDGLSVTDVVIKFKIDTNAAETSIDNLMVFKYFENTNMLLPIETTYDESTNAISTHVDEVGTYCLIDVEKWLEILEETPAGNYYEGGENEPANIVFCLDTRGVIDEESFNAVKTDIKAITENAFDRYSDIKVYVYYQQFGSDFKAANKLLTDSNGNNYFTGYEEVVAALDKLETYMIKNNYWAYDFVEATQFMIDNCDEKIIAMYHITADDRVMGGINKAKKLTQTVQNSKYTTAEGEEIQRIYVSTLCPNDTEPFDTSSYAYELAKLSGGIAVTGYDANEDTEVMTVEVESIEVYANDEEETKTSSNVKNNLTDILGEGMDLKDFKIISSAGLTEISLKTPLRINEYYTSKSKKPTDTDEDGLYDWDEVCINAIEAIKGDNIKDGILLPNNMPSLLECMTYYNKHGKGYVGKGFEKYMNENNSNPHHVLNSTCILPINSDPTSIDSDDDGFLDNAYVNNYENVDEKDKITYEWVKQSDKYFNVSDPNPLKKEIIWQWPVVSAEAVESYVDSEGNTKYRSKVDENGEKLVFKDEYKCKNLQASFVEKRGSFYHKAIDITTHSDDTYYVIAAYDGTIYKINNTCEHISSAYGENEGCGCGGGWGNYIAINSTINNDTFTAVYAHLEYDSLLIKQGYVKAGDVIAVVGSSGNSEAVHLDFSIRTGSYIETDAETGNKNEKIGKKCYDPIIFNSYCENNKLSEFELNHFIDLPKKLKKMCSTPSDGCTNYYPLIEEYYKIEMDEKV